MDTDAHGLEMNLTEAVIGSAFEVSKALGAGFLEKVYERAMLRELTLRGVSAKTQASFPVCYKGQYVGEYCTDLVVDEKVIVELNVRGPAWQRTSGSMHQLLKGLRSSRGAAHQFPKAQGGMEACPPGPVAANICLVISWTLR